MYTPTRRRNSEPRASITSKHEETCSRSSNPRQKQQQEHSQARRSPTCKSQPRQDRAQRSAALGPRAAGAGQTPTDTQSSATIETNKHDAARQQAGTPIQLPGVLMRKKTTKPPSSPTHTKKGAPKIRHRHASGQFKAPPPAQSAGPTISKKPTAPAELDQDSGGGFRPGEVDPQT